MDYAIGNLNTLDDTAEYEKKSEIMPKRVNDEDYHEDNVLMIGN